MRALSINFSEHRHRPSVTGLLVFVAASLALLSVTMDYFDARDQLQQSQARQERQLRLDSALKRSSKAAVVPVDEIKKLMLVTQQLQLPWDVILRDLESAVEPDVALVGVEGNGQSRTLRLTGEAKAMAKALAYVDRLRQSPQFQAVTISGHEEKLVGADKVVRFSVDLNWRALP